MLSIYVTIPLVIEYSSSLLERSELIISFGPKLYLQHKMKYFLLKLIKWFTYYN